MSTNIYGTATQSFPYSRKTLVPNCFIEEAINLETITIKASSPVYRNFVSIHKIELLSNILPIPYSKPLVLLIYAGVIHMKSKMLQKS